jgi:hypothetical protein
MGIDLALRTSLVWNGEVMNDLVLDRPAPVTIGATGKTTFVTPDIGIAELAILQPGSAGYLLTLSDRMGGTVCLGGQQHAVSELVAGQPFHATPIAVGDWGVIDLDDEGRSQIFFQFVPREEHAEIVTRQQLNIGAAGFALFSLVGAVIFALKGLEIGEALFRSIGVTALIFAGAALAHVVMKQDNNSKASLAFSIILHTAILSFTFHVYSTESAEAAQPGPRELTAQYLVNRPEAPMQVMVSIAKALPAFNPTVAAAPPTETPAPKPSGGGDGGTPKPKTNAGGRGIKAPATVPSQFGVLGHPEIAVVIGHDVGHGIGQLAGVGGPKGIGPKGPPGPPRMTKSDGKDPNAPSGDHKKGDEIGPIKIRAAVCIGACGGGVPPIEIKRPPNEPEDAPNRLTSKEIDDVIRRRASLFRSCYQNQVNHLPDLAGSVVMRFVIATDGSVRNAKRSGGTLRNDGVTQCMERNMGLLQFPPKGPATVTYPFVFSIGG